MILKMDSILAPFKKHQPFSWENIFIANNDSHLILPRQLRFVDSLPQKDAKYHFVLDVVNNKLFKLRYLGLNTR